MSSCRKSLSQRSPQMGGRRQCRSPRKGSKSPKRRRSSSPRRHSPRRRSSSPRRRSCGSGRIRRASYYRRPYTRADGTRVKGTRVGGTCIKDLGLKGRGPRILPKGKAGGLKKHGYSLCLSAEKRHQALRKAVRAEGALPVLRHINLRRNYIRRTQPGNWQKFTNDLTYVQRLYGSK